MYNIVNNLTPNFGKLFMTILVDKIAPFNVTASDNSVSILVNESYSYKQSLVFDNATIEGLAPTDYVKWFELRKEKNQYCLEWLYYNEEDDSDSLCVIRFSLNEMKVKNEVYNAMDVGCFDNPWEYVATISNEIVEKSENNIGKLNSEETELLPLAKALRQMFIYRYGLTKISINDTKIFFDIAKPFGFDKLKTKANKYEKFETIICNKKYEPFWRRIYEMLKKSQKEYPSKANALCSEGYLEQIRMQITNVLRKNGFQGEYPHFYKPSSIKGVKLIESYKESFFLLNEKNTIHHITCIENHYETFQIEFVCGMKCRKKFDNELYDAFSCMFNAKGKCYVKTFNAYLSEIIPKFMDDVPIASEFATVAVKKAMLENLSTKESENPYFNDNGFIKNQTHGFFIIVGILFGILMTCSLIIFEFLITVMQTGLTTEFDSVISVGQWLLIFIFASVSFGGLMAFIGCKARNK